MQLLESLLSLLALLSFSLFLTIPADAKIDNSLYLQELQGDAKNVIYLKGGFENLSAGNDAAMEVLEKTGMCMEMDSTELTSNLVSDDAPSSYISIPKLKEYYLFMNGTAVRMQNLTNFTADRIHFGPCLR